MSVRGRDGDRAWLCPQVKHLRGGIFGWYNAGLPTQGDYDATNVGRTPMVVEEEMFSYGRAPEQLNESR